MTKEEILKNLEANFGIDGDDAIEIFESYKKALKENIETMSAKDLSADTENIARAAHSIKGCALNCGDDKMASTAKVAQLAAIALDEKAFYSALNSVKNLASELFPI